MMELVDDGFDAGEYGTKVMHDAITKGGGGKQLVHHPRVSASCSKHEAASKRMQSRTRIHACSLNVLVSVSETCRLFHRSCIHRIDIEP